MEGMNSSSDCFFSLFLRRIFGFVPASKGCRRESHASPRRLRFSNFMFNILERSDHTGEKMLKLRFQFS